MSTRIPERRARWRRGSLPLLLALLGAALFGQWLDWELRLGLLSRLWPLLLITAGLELLLAHRRRGLGLLLGLLLSLALGGYLLSSGQLGPRQQVRFPIDRPLARVERAEVYLNLGGADVRIVPLPPDSTKLVEGIYESRRTQLSQRYQIDAGVARLNLQTQGGFGLDWDGHADLHFSRTAPLTLYIDGDATAFDLDLGQLQIERLQLSAEASNGVLRLPATGQVVLQANASALSLVLPPDVPARIRIRSTATRVEVSNSQLRQQGDAYITPGWEQATARLDVEVEGQASSITIR